MKKVLALLFVALLLLQPNSSNSALANTKLEITGGVLYESRVLVPMRAIFEEFGAVVHWDQDTRTVTAMKDEITIELGINQMWATVNGEHINLDVYTQINDGITVVPLRFVAETLGAQVKWDSKQQIAIVLFKDKEINISISTWIKVIDEKDDSSSNKQSTTSTQSNEQSNEWVVYGKTIKKGMTPDQVMQLIGKPDNFYRYSEEEILNNTSYLPGVPWGYIRSGIRYDYVIYFHMGVVLFVEDLSGVD